MARLEKQISSQDFKVISQGLGIANFTLPTSLDKIERLSPLLLKGKERELGFLRQGLKFLGKPITSINENVNLSAGYGTSGSNALLGPLWDGHGLTTNPITFGYNLTEPMVTKGISHACSGFDSTLPFLDVKVAFIRALFSAAGIEKTDQNFLADFSAAKIEPEKIVIKKKTKKKKAKNKYIDLWFDWTDRGGTRQVIVVEAKINARESGDQLKFYHARAKEILKDHDPICFFLTIHGNRPDDENDWDHWKSISWLKLMQFWERYLSDVKIPPASDFNRFRSEIWRLILP